MAKVLKRVFKTSETVSVDNKDVEKEIELAIRVPNGVEKEKARRIYAATWRLAVEDGAIMREALDRHLRDQKLWDDMREKEFKKLRSSILEGERKLKMGGNAGLTKNKARDLAIEIGEARSSLTQLLTEKNRVDAHTAESLAEQAQFNYFVAVCTVYNDTGKPYFTHNGEPSIDVYDEKSTEKVGQDAATKFAEMWYGTTEDTAETLPDKKFLKEYGFADDKGRLIDKQGRLIDRKGRLINEEDRYVNEKGEFVDAEGRRVDENGQYIVDFAPFIDDEENQEKPSPASPPEVKVEDEEEQPVST